MKFLFSFFFLLSVCGIAQEVQAQKVISGRVMDAGSKEPLASAHVIIKDTYKGTITNADGEFRLQIDEFPATIVVRFLGFESREITVDASTSMPVNFLLKESVSEMGEITVTGEDPAISIMKEVIRRKQIWRKNLNTYKAEAYTRQQLKNDTSIVSITESISVAYWDKEKGSREVLKSRRQTANIDAGSNFAGVSYLPNFYDDNLDIAGFDVVGVTHPDALSYYNFELTEIHSMDNQVVFEIEVSSKRKLQPLFEGTIFVLSEEFALLEVDLKPNSVIAFPAPVQDFNISYAQQFSNFGGDFWLPVDVRMEGTVKVGVIGLRFPPIGFSQVARLSDYEVNIDLPDTLFRRGRTFSVDSTTIHSGDSLFIAEVDIIPLNQEEEEAYETLDSTATLEKAFEPKGFLARFLDLTVEDESASESESTQERAQPDSSKVNNSSRSKGPSLLSKITRNLKPMARYNRVDAFYGELAHERRYLDNKLSARIYGGYSTGYGAMSYGVKLSSWPFKSRRYALFGEFNSTTRTRYDSDFFSINMNSIPVILGYDDYFDYYRSDGFKIGYGFRPKARWAANAYLYYKYEKHSLIDYETNYNILGRDIVQRPNSYIDEGSLSAFEFRWAKGNDRKALGAIGANDIGITIEHSAKALGSEWDYTRFKIDLYRRYDTFYQRRFFPNTLDLRLNAGTYIGDLPVQKNGVLDVAPGIFTPFGVFKAKRFKPYEGASYFALNAEHNFKSVPLEMLGWRDASKTGLSVIVFGGIGKTWLRQEQINEFNIRYGYSPASTDGLHMEAGVSLSNIFNLFRADLAFRIDEPGVFIGVSLARFF